MELLFKREQTSGRLARVTFKLWAKVELDNEERALVERYRFDEAILIAAIQPTLMRNTIFIGVAVFILIFGFFAMSWSTSGGFLLGVIASGGVGYWYLNEKRETIFVRDLLYGRNFTCDSVIELARKEAYLVTIVSYLRQVMESAKHWGGTEHLAIEALPKDEARQVILRGL